MSEAADKALAGFKSAFSAHLTRAENAPVSALMTRIYQIADWHEINPRKTSIERILERAAEHGSIEALAMMFTIGMPERRVLKAALELARRSPDLREGLVNQALTKMAEEILAEQAAKKTERG